MGKEIDEMFRKAVMDHPEMAKSHFEIVDPGVWRFVVSGRLLRPGCEWIGPYQFRNGGVDYEAYGLRRRILASQKMFLEDLGILVPERGVSVPERGPSGLVKVVSVVIGFCLLVAFAVLAICSSFSEGRSAKAVDGSKTVTGDNGNPDYAELDAMLEKVEKRYRERHAPKRPNVKK